ncbi:Scarecrow-like protein [Musa troglodytarum]|uniref:Scarecrow-like protein n=3 Tax=Musa troglodytarum TaxID=320322 RepID=A0A9E7HKS4_9LILI|nr:Scarecrow-like protein [Musa troglodytarum]
MRGLPYHAQGKGGLEAVETIFEGNQALFWVNKRPKLVIQQGREPRSVLDHRSPSPPTSTATLSSSLGGGGGSSDTAGVAAVSDIPTNKWVLSDSTAEESGGAVGKEEWAAELQPIPTGLDMGFVAGGQKYGLGVDDWEAILSETSAASPGREQTFFRWIMGDVDDPSAAGFKQHQQQLLSHGSVEFDGNSSGLGFGIPDPGIGLGSIGRTADEASVSAPTDSSLPLSSNVTSGGGFSLVSSSSRVSPAIVHAYIKGATFGHQTGSQLFSLPPQAGNSISSPLSLPQGMYFPDTVLDKPQLFGPGLLLNQASATPNPPFFLSAAQAEQQQLPQLLPPTQLKRHPAIADQIPQKLPFLDSAASSDLFLRRQSYQEQSHGFPLRQLQNRSVKPVVAAFGDDVTSAVAAQQQHLQQALADLLFEAAKMVEARNFVGAHGILARLNQQLPSPSGKPLIRSAFYFKEALQLIISNGSNTVPSATPTSHHPLTTQLDVVHKLSAYKAFSEVSPIIRFANFTCIQALLEELDGCDCIHIMDFDIGFGGQWSSFMQELAQRRCSSAGAVRMLKITVFVSHYSQNNMELHLIQDNLSQFASDLNIPFELKVHSLDSFDPLELHGLGGEAIAVNLPIGSAYLSFPALLRLMKQLSPKIVVSVDQGCDRSDLPFLQHFLHAFQSSLVLMDSIDASGTNQDTASKIERFLLQPKIESSVLGRYRAADKMLPWRTLFETAGFVPIQFSNFAETQAECLLKRVQIRGFHVEKRQASLYLYWQRKELVSVSAWRC